MNAVIHWVCCSLVFVGVLLSLVIMCTTCWKKLGVKIRKVQHSQAVDREVASHE